MIENVDQESRDTGRSILGFLMRKDMKRYWMVCLGHLSFDVVLAFTEEEAIKNIRDRFGDETNYIYYEKYRAFLIE